MDSKKLKLPLFLCFSSRFSEAKALGESINEARSKIGEQMIFWTLLSQSISQWTLDGGPPSSYSHKGKLAPLPGEPWHTPSSRKAPLCVPGLSLCRALTGWPSPVKKIYFSLGFSSSSICHSHTIMAALSHISKGCETLFHRPKLRLSFFFFLHTCAISAPSIQPVGRRRAKMS